MSRMTPELRRLMGHYEPLIAQELRRIGVSEEDAGWIRGGSGGEFDLRDVPDLYERELRILRALPDDIGVRGYCQVLGFDYDEMKRRIVGPHPEPH